jgi:2-polyprenyl-3-methyl-5-hydroxy-6-metoxy-1,4-benzoquinol methylase
MRLGLGNHYEIINRSNSSQSVAISERCAKRGGGESILDIGSGTGELISLIQSHSPKADMKACDYIDTLMEISGQKVDVVNLNNDPLPYESNSFDLVTCTEVIEHLENYHRLVRETHRVLKPNGIVILTTPNILNLRSRLRFMFFGFWNLFGPLPLVRTETYSTDGHITPISYFYLAHALSEAGLTVKLWTTDKLQRGSIPKLVFWLPLIKFFSFFTKRQEKKKYQTIDAANESMVNAVNAWEMLLGRTIIVVAQKINGFNRRDPICSDG